MSGFFSSSGLFLLFHFPYGITGVSLLYGGGWRVEGAKGQSCLFERGNFFLLMFFFLDQMKRGLCGQPGAGISIIHST